MTAGPEIPEAANSKLEDTPMLFAPNTRRAAILNYLLFSLSLTAGLLCAAPNAAAQTSLTVNVPFAFSANNQHLPAGSYQIQRLSEFFLSIRNAKTASTIVVMIRPEQGRLLESHSRLVFNRDGNQNYLTQVWASGTNRYSKLTSQHRQDQELRTQIHSAPSTVEVAAK
jgi:hypothetical protein